MSGIKVGDYVVPHYPHFPRLALTPCRVRNVYKNGTLRARSDDGSVEWKGPVDGFRTVAAEVDGRADRPSWVDEHGINHADGDGDRW